MTQFVRGVGGNIIADNMGNIMITVNVTKVIKETDKAYNLDIDGDKVWLPKGNICLEKDRMKVAIPEWLYKQKFPKG